MTKVKCQCNPSKPKWHGGCAHFSGGKCRLVNYRMDCQMSTTKYCYICCPFLNSEEGKALVKIYEQSKTMKE